eukprot:jgi/Tetstr1/455050/TSEL_041906.t1
MKGRQHRIDRTGLPSREPQISTLQDRLLADYPRDQGADADAEDPAGQVAGVSKRLSSISRGAPTSSEAPWPGQQAAAGLHCSGASFNAEEARATLESLAMYPGGTPADAFDGSDNEESEADDEADEEEENIVRYFQGKLPVILITIVSLVVIGLSIFVQVMPWSCSTIGKNAVYVRWICMAGTIVPVYYITHNVVNYVFVAIELRLFRESLAYLSNLNNASANMIFVYVELAIFYVVFHVAFCFGDFTKTCQDPDYVKGTRTGIKSMWCLGLFFTASWLACLASKVLSTHYYRSTHFLKLREALNKEHMLHALSMPKRKVTHVHTTHAGMNEAAEAAQATAHGSGASGTPSASSLTSVAISISGNQPNGQHDDQDGAAATLLGAVDEEPESGSQLPKESTVDELEDEENLERLRTAVVVKTYSTLVNLYKLPPCEESESRMRRRVKAFSKALFKNMSWTGEANNREYVTLEDFELFFEPTRQGRMEAARAFALFDWDKSGKVDRDETRKAVMAIFNQRACVASALEDTDSIVKSLESGFAGGLHFIFIAFYLYIWRINLVAGLTTFSALFVGLSFIFGNSIRIMFEALLFLFNEHPYDVGDIVSIDDNPYEIKKVRLLYTVMEDTSGHTLFISSKELLEKRISNWTRSKTHSDYWTPEVDVGVASAVKTELCNRMNAHIKEHASEYEAPAKVILKGMSTNNLKVSMAVSYTMNFSPAQWTRLSAARDSMMQIVSDVLAKYQESGEVEHTTARVRMKQM